MLVIHVPLTVRTYIKVFDTSEPCLKTTPELRPLIGYPLQLVLYYYRIKHVKITPELRPPQN